MAGTERLPSAIGYTEKVEPKIGFEHRGHVPDGSVKSRGLEFGNELSAAYVFVTTALVFAPRIFGIARCRERKAHFARGNQRTNGIQEVSDVCFLTLGNGRLHNKFSVADGLGNEREAVGRCGCKKLVDFGGSGAHLLVDFSLHAASEQLLVDRIFKFSFPLTDGLTVLCFECLDRAKHLDVIGESSLNFVHDFGRCDFNAVETRLVNQ